MVGPPHSHTNVLTRARMDAVLVIEDTSTALFTWEIDMKVCNKCGIEIDGLDGDNYCPDCDRDDPPPSPKQKQTKKLSRKAREEIYRELGLVKVKGALGGSYWE